MIAQSREFRVVILLRDGLSQRVIKRQNLHVVGDAFRQDVELALENIRRRRQFVLRFLDQVRAQVGIGHQRRQHLHRRQRDDEKQREAVAEPQLHQ